MKALQKLESFELLLEKLSFFKSLFQKALLNNQKKSFYGAINLGDIYKLRNVLGERFVTNHCKDIGICTVFYYKGVGGV